MDNLFGAYGSGSDDSDEDEPKEQQPASKKQKVEEEKPAAPAKGLLPSAEDMFDDDTGFQQPCLVTPVAALD